VETSRVSMSTRRMLLPLSTTTAVRLSGVRAMLLIPSKRALVQRRPRSCSAKKTLRPCVPSQQCNLLSLQQPPQTPPEARCGGPLLPPCAASLLSRFRARGLRKTSQLIVGGGLTPREVPNGLKIPHRSDNYCDWYQTRDRVPNSVPDCEIVFSTSAGVYYIGCTVIWDEFLLAKAASFALYFSATNRLFRRVSMKPLRKSLGYQKNA